MGNSRDFVKSGLVDPLDYRTLNFDVPYTPLTTDILKFKQTVLVIISGSQSVQGFFSLVRTNFLTPPLICTSTSQQKYFNMAGEFVFRWPLYNDYKELTCHRSCSGSG